MNWLLKTLLAVVLLIFAFDAKEWVARAWGVALDERESRWEELVGDRKAQFDGAVTDAAQRLVKALESEVEALRVSALSTKVGASVTRDQIVMEVRSKRASFEVRSPSAGAVSSLVVSEGESVAQGAVLFEVKDPEGTIVKAMAPTAITAGGRALPISVLPLSEDVDRRATAALEAQLVSIGWNVQAGASLGEAMSQTDLRAMMERLWDRISPSDLFDRNGVDRLVFGRILSVEFETPQCCSVDLEVRAIDRSGEMLFAQRQRGTYGPEPTLLDYAAAHPLRILGVMLAILWIVLVLFFRQRVIPYADRSQQEALDQRATESGRAFSKSMQELLADLRRAQDAHVRQKRPFLARALAEEIDRGDQIRQGIESLSRVRQREALLHGFWPQTELATLTQCVRGYSVEADDEACQKSLAQLHAAIDTLRDAVRTRTTT